MMLTGILPGETTLSKLQCGREGRNVGFPTLTHDRIVVRNEAHNTCERYRGLLAIVSDFIFIS